MIDANSLRRAGWVFFAIAIILLAMAFWNDNI